MAALPLVEKVDRMFTGPMRREDVLLRTKLSPPQLQRRVLPRPALAAQLREALDYRLTLMQAGTGYSKTTALASLDTGDTPLFWYSIGESDADPQRFLSYLIGAFRARLPEMSDLPLAILQERGSEGSREAWSQILDALINALADSLIASSLLVLDDYHFVSGSEEISLLIERLVDYLPARLHLIISTRYPVSSPGLVKWRAKGAVLEINRQKLAFRPEEIEALFRDAYGMELSRQELNMLVEKTEGWPIALQLVWQGLRNAPTRNAGDLMRDGSTSLGTLFDYLANDVLGTLPPDIAAFLRDTAVLRELTPGSCDAVTGRPRSELLLEKLLELDLFIVMVGDRHYRYHHLFHDFLAKQAEADPEGTLEHHQRAAWYFEARQDYEEAIYHWLQAGETRQAAAVIELAGEAALRAGWLDTVTTWIEALPEEMLAARPLLQAYLGDIYRMHSRFDDAMGWYARAEQKWRELGDPVGVSRALRGQALVYLDTVRPAQAQSYLEEALRLTEGVDDRENRARLLEMLAENKLNMGKPDEAEKLRADARALRSEGPGEDVLSVRVKLRTGRLDEAQRTLESWVKAERREAALGQVHPPRGHREFLLMLSLIHAFRGEAGSAFQMAQEGIDVGGRLGSPFVTAIGHVRLGHAWQLRRTTPVPPPNDQVIEEAIRCYHTGISMGDELAVRRVRAEAMWGLTRAYGFSGDLDSAKRSAAEGVETGRWAGDAWIVALIELLLGATHILAGYTREGADILTRVLGDFRDCGDPFGRAATRLWLAIAYHELKQPELLAASIDEGLALCEAHSYDFLFTRPTLLGPPDPRRLVPCLIAARNARKRRPYVARLLGEIGLPDIQVHPGYRLSVRTLGTFSVHRGDIEVEQRDWQRDKARQLFQLLLTRRGEWLQREEIAEYLWPNLSAEAASRDFKVALNALNRAIEPGRSPDATFAYIVREGSAYRLRAEADLWIDAVAFEQECQVGLRLMESSGPDLTNEPVGHLREALSLYKGNYLPDTLYEDWASAERERLLSLFLRAADRLAGALVEQEQYEEALVVCQRIVAHDPCWERAYRWMMLAHARMGNRTMALRAYQRCAQAMADELGTEPSTAITDLYRRILEAPDPQQVG